jgi:hypothetical protein
MSPVMLVDGLEAVPRLVLPCAGFICTTGYGLALNASHPELIPILRDVLVKVKDIFSTTPFFHFGGDAVGNVVGMFPGTGNQHARLRHF